MSRKLSKRKRSEREVYLVKEKDKISEGVFDNRTLLNITKFFNHKLISQLLFVISTGKEADVYLAKSGQAVEENNVAVKIFRLETSSFQKRINYINGDPRFGKVNNKIQNVVKIWCKKEFGNLKLANELGVYCPKPYKAIGNVLVMEFIGDKDGNPAFMLKDTVLENPKEILAEILKNIKLMYRGKMVHADISEYNILMHNNTPFLIDFGQAVVKGHPMFETFFERDVDIILNYFRRKYQIESDIDSILSDIRKA